MSQVGRAPGSTYWEVFYRRFPHASGHATFSAPRYSAAGQQVEIDAGIECGDVCAENYTFVFALDHKKSWRLVHIINGAWALVIGTKKTALARSLG